MTEQAFIYLFVVPGILALYGLSVWFDAWRRTRALDTEIAAYHAKRPANGRVVDSTVRVAIPDPVEVVTRPHSSRVRNRRARAESMRVSPLRRRQQPSELSPGE